MEKKLETTIMGYIGVIGYMGGFQNYGPFLDTLNVRCCIYRDPKKDHNFDHHPHKGFRFTWGLGFWI